jgi:hypothetical protein
MLLPGMIETTEEPETMVDSGATVKTDSVTVAEVTLK